MRRIVFNVMFFFAVYLVAAFLWLDDRLRFAFPFPRNFDDLLTQKDWLIARLKEAGAIPHHAHVTSVVLNRIKADEAFRSTIARVDITCEGGEKLALAAKFAPVTGSLKERAVYVLQGNHTKEVGFYRDIAPTLDGFAPKVYAAEVSKGTGYFCLLLEWLGHGTEITEAEGCPASEAQKIIHALAAMHARYWGKDHPASEWLTPLPPDIIPFFQGLLEGPHLPLFRDLLDRAWRHHSQAPLTVIHGDGRIGNHMFTPGRVMLFDWQCTRLGKGVFDLAYFMSISMQVDTRRTHERALLEAYQTALAEYDISYPFETLEDDYKWSIVLVLVFFRLPYLITEANTDENNTQHLVDVARVWFERLFAVIHDFDYRWLAKNCPFAEDELRRAFLESAESSGQTLEALVANYHAGGGPTVPPSFKTSRHNPAKTS